MGTDERNGRERTGPGLSSPSLPPSRSFSPSLPLPLPPSLPPSLGLIRSRSVSLGPFIVKTSHCLSLMFASPVVGYMIAMLTPPLPSAADRAGALPLTSASLYLPLFLSSSLSLSVCLSLSLSLSLRLFAPALPRPATLH